METFKNFFRTYIKKNNNTNYDFVSAEKSLEILEETEK